jgi:iron complex outermembrane receptor protein
VNVIHSAVFAASVSVVAIANVALAPRAIAQTSAQQDYRLPAQPLDASLRAVALASGRNIGAPAPLITGKVAPALTGRFTPEEAVAHLLRGSGLRSRVIDGDLIIARDVQSLGDESVGDQSEAIIVTGSRIRGARIASPVIRFDREDLLRSGQTSMAQVVQNLPQAFGGGQNPGVGANVPAASGINVGGATTINLRGLGSDATLTLLNGRRLAYNGSRQGIDVSAIPLGAIDRLEVVADGASALYGSDAVAGVANIILRPDFDGLRLDAEGALATQGDWSNQRYGLTTGTRWASGGIIASYEFARSPALRSNDRSFTSANPGLTIYPPLKRHALVISGHQALSDNLNFAVDLLYNHRRSQIDYPLNSEGDLALSHIEQPSTSRSIAIAPSLSLTLPGDWNASLSGVYGNERTFLRSRVFEGTEQIATQFVCYCNSGQSVELGADGGLFRLPAGLVRIAIGAGYRRNLLNADRGADNVASVRRDQDSYYGYGELSVPLVAPDMELGLVHRLDLSGAVRYERYPGIDRVATPKFGIIYAPSADVDLKASWGRSFRAPSLLQQNQVPSVSLYPVASLGGAGYAPGASALLISGGNPGLTPERAETWTASIDIHPSVIEGARLQLSYFHTRYTDRIVSPISFSTQSLSNPIYAGLVTLNPSQAVAAEIINSALQFTDLTDDGADPSNVVAIVDNRNRNSSRQTIKGVDILLDYRFKLGQGELTATVNASYLHIVQQLIAGQAQAPRAGILFTPPHWRGRGSLNWRRGSLNLNGTLNYIGGVDDDRVGDDVRVRGMTTIDLTAQVHLEQVWGAFKNIDLSLSALNAFNAKPRQIVNYDMYDSTYDSTNYSPIGRVLSLGISTTW